MKMYFRLFLNIILLSLSLTFLVACYETNEPLIAKGEFAPISGRFTCRSDLDGRSMNLQVEEQTSGILFRSYSYTIDDGEVLARKISDSFYLAQTKGSKDMVYRYAFFSLSEKGLSVLVPDVMTKSSSIDQYAKSQNVQFAVSGMDHIGLVGPEAEKLKFLMKHERELLTRLFACTKNQ